MPAVSEWIVLLLSVSESATSDLYGTKVDEEERDDERMDRSAEEVGMMIDARTHECRVCRLEDSGENWLGAVVAPVDCGGDGRDRDREETESSDCHRHCCSMNDDDDSRVCMVWW